MKAITQDFANRFKESYNYKMGGTQTLVFPNGQEFFFDDREYYSGRGAKYNSSIKHDDKGEVIISKKQVSSALKSIKEIAKRVKEVAQETKLKSKRYNDLKVKGLYGIGSDSYVELTDEEMEGQFFDAVRLANTLDISIDDAKLLESCGKTYVFAKQSNGSTIMLYHASLSCNSLSIFVDFNPSQEFMQGFKSERQQWTNAPFAGQVGMTSNENHFVC